MSAGIWRALWKYISVTVLIPPGRSPTQLHQTSTQMEFAASAPPHQAVAFLLKNTETALSHISVLLGLSL